MYVNSVRYIVRTKKGDEYIVMFHKEGGKLWSAYVDDVDGDEKHYDAGCSQRLRPSQSVAMQIVKVAIKYWSEGNE